jgi:3-methyladenine DNA glycosylase Tag
MRPFDDIIALAAQRKGGVRALERLLEETPSRSPAAIAATPDDRILAAMTRRVFYAGFSSRVIDAKWEAFETAFRRFDPQACAYITEKRFDALASDTSIVRNLAKIRSVQANAVWMLELAEAHGSAARFLARWPDSDYAGLLEVLKKQGSRLGGESGMRFLRAIGKPAFVLTPDVVTALVREGVVRRAPGGKQDFAAVQSAFNEWSGQSKRDLTQISRILTMSVESGAARRHTAKPPIRP